MSKVTAVMLVIGAFTVGVVTSCTKDVKPQPPVVVEPTPAPSATPTPTPVDPNVDPDAEYCKKGDKTFYCGNPVWYGLKGCKPDSDGDNHAEGDAYFATLKEIEDLAKSSGVTTRVTMLDGTFRQYGIGFAAPCVELAKGAKSLAKDPGFEKFEKSFKLRK